MNETHTPGFVGYLVAVLASCLVLPGVLILEAAALGAADRARGGELATAYLVMGVFSLVLGLPIGTVGALVVHFCCRSEPRQWVHVVVAGAVGIGIPLALLMLIYSVGPGSPLVVLTQPVGVAAAIGRAAVIPIVHGRRRRFASRTPLRVP